MKYPNWIYEYFSNHTHCIYGKGMSVTDLTRGWKVIYVIENVEAIFPRKSNRVL
jgi:hypothetical protein